MTVETKVNFNREYVTQYSQRHQEPAWLLELRLQGLELSEKLSLPVIEKTKIDTWPLLPTAHEGEEAFITEVAQLPKTVHDMLGGAEEDAKNIVIHKNSQPIFNALAEDLKSKGVIFTDIKTAIKEHEALVSKYYMNQVAKVDEHKISALHAALMNSGVFLYVPKNVQIEQPLQSLFWQENSQIGLVPHILIVAEENSQLTYVENYFGSDNEDGINNYVAEVIVGNNAQVTFAAVDHLGAKTTSYVYRKANVANDGRIDWALGQMHSGNTVSDNTTYLKGKGAIGDTKSVVVGTGEQSLNFVQKMVQTGHYTEGEMLSHGVMRESARAIFNGITKIEKGALKSTGEQTERVLMLSEKARGDANPILLIDENVERAGHAASVGKVDPMQLFYLMSRGISKQDAEKLIILGFLSPVVELIPLEGLKKRLVELIERKVK
ncbi:Fe-S cluster assembly protein SufD [Bacillus horti]|uniref:Fe-S cluster assembly protein SufD n=1 Tax=Caldalkalibacillus horti TaxID=77523 RepID=A0ABT9VTW9_9BACI|nr:Fe-S cluster assembly protein SufD [Bacillus horti]MDQ0164431.1 Fe-S cluster assembly protein SufD [Bacillus horti]